MFEKNNDPSRIDYFYEISKNGFDIIRNSLIVVTLGYLGEKSQSSIILAVYHASSAMLGVFVGALFGRIEFKNSYFSDTNEGRWFKLILSGIVFIGLGVAVNYASGQLIKEAVKYQTNEKSKCP